MSMDEWCDEMAVRSRTLTAEQRVRYISKRSGLDGILVEDRFAAAFVQAGDCWIWQRRLGNSCQPTMTVNGHPVTSARWAWVEAGGAPLSSDDILGTNCGTGPLCVNPQHHDLTTHSEKNRRGHARRVARQKALEVGDADA